MKLCEAVTLLQAFLTSSSIPHKGLPPPTDEETEVPGGGQLAQGHHSCGLQDPALQITSTVAPPAKGCGLKSHHLSVPQCPHLSTGQEGVRVHMYTHARRINRSPIRKPAVSANKCELLSPHKAPACPQAWECPVSFMLSTGLPHLGGQ